MPHGCEKRQIEPNAAHTWALNVFDVQSYKILFTKYALQGFEC